MCSMPAVLRAFVITVFATGLLDCQGSLAPAASIEEFGDRLEAIRLDLRIPGMTAVIASDQRIVWSRGYGWADMENRIPAADTSSYHLASLTKTFASTVI